MIKSCFFTSLNLQFFFIFKKLKHSKNPKNSHTCFPPISTPPTGPPGRTRAVFLKARGLQATTRLIPTSAKEKFGGYFMILRFVVIPLLRTRRLGVGSMRRRRTEVGVVPSVANWSVGTAGCGLGCRMAGGAVPVSTC